ACPLHLAGHDQRSAPPGSAGRSDAGAATGLADRRRSATAAAGSTTTGAARGGAAVAARARAARAGGPAARGRVVGREVRRAVGVAVGAAGTALLRRARALALLRATLLPRLLAARLLGPAAVGVAVAAGAGVHAIGHVPAAERGGVAFGQRALVLALLERLVGLLGGGFAADGEAAVAALARLAATAAVLAH